MDDTQRTDDCLVPLQLGVGVPGGAEVLVHTARTLLENNPGWACASNDLRNGFNACRRDKVLEAVRSNPRFSQYYPSLYKQYCRHATLLANGKPIFPPAAHVDAPSSSETQYGSDSGDQDHTGPLRQPTQPARAVTSRQGVRQGDPAGPWLFAAALHPALLALQAAFPDVHILAYLDDVYLIGPPARAHSALLQLQETCRATLELDSRMDKVEFYCPAATEQARPALAAGDPPLPTPPLDAEAAGAQRGTSGCGGDPLSLPCLHSTPDIKGSPWNPEPAKRFIRGFKCLGTFIGERDWVVGQLRSTLQKHLAPLATITQLADTDKHRNRLQCQLAIIRWCTASSANYWLRTTPTDCFEPDPDHPTEAASAHDAPLQAALADILEFDATTSEGAAALTQISLPRSLGGLGIPLAAATAGPAYLGSIVSNWHLVARLTPALAAVDFTEPATLPPSLARAAATHNALSTDQLALARAYVAIDALPKTGHGGLSVYRPSGLPTAPPPLSQCSTQPLKSAQRVYSHILHHRRWKELYESLADDGKPRDLVRLIQTSQPDATAFLAALPTRLNAVIDTASMLTATQRLLGVPLSVLSGLSCDPFGDTAVNANTDFTIRHNAALDAWVKALKKVFRGHKVDRGGRIDADCLPDGTIYEYPTRGLKTYLEVKLKSPLGSDGAPNNPDGERAAFAGLCHLSDEIHDKYSSRLGSNKLITLIADTFGALHPDARKAVLDANERLARGRDTLAPTDPCDPRAGAPSPDEKRRVPRPLLPVSIAVHCAIAAHIHRYADQLRSAADAA